MVDPTLVLGILGNIISVCLFLSPFPTFIRVFKNRSTEGFSCFIYIATLFNCLLWVLYGLPFVQPGRLLVITINGFGVFIEAAYIVTFLIFANKAEWRKAATWAMGVIVVILGIALGIFLGAHKKSIRADVVGIICIVANTCMYAAPLTIVFKVVKTKSVEFMPLPISVANFLNGIVWTLYGVLKPDTFVIIPNALGIFFAVLQLGLYAWYGWLCVSRSTTTKTTKGKSEIELREIPDVENGNTNQH